MKKYSSLFFLTLFFFFAFVEKGQAVALFPGETISGYREYIQAFYRFSIPVALLIATVLIMIGGVIWITSAGNQTRISKAQEFIIQPLIGVVLLAGAYTLLAIINPNLVDLRLQIETLTNIEGGSCLTVDPSTYSTKTRDEKTQTCFASCSVATDAEDCKRIAEKKGSTTAIFESGNCNKACVQDIDAPVRCANIPPFRSSSVFDCNNSCASSTRHPSEKGQQCFGASYSDQRICTCGIGPPLEATAAQQAREERIKQTRIQAVADPYQASQRGCSTRSQEINENHDKTFSNGEDFWGDNCQSWCSGAPSFSGTGPEGTEITADCDYQEEQSRCTDTRPGTVFGTTCYAAFCACALEQDLF